MWAWYHRQFIEISKERYLHLKEDQLRATQCLADYYSSILSEKFPDRGISHQPLYWESDTDFVFNHMKISQLPTALITCSQQHQFENLICSLEFIAAKCTIGLGRELVRDYLRAQKEFPSEKIAHFTHFASNKMHVLETSPELVIQEALDMSEDNMVSGYAKAETNATPWIAVRPLVLGRINKPQGKDPAQLTLQGHRGSIYSLVLHTVQPTNGRAERYLNAISKHSIMYWYI